MKCPLCVAVAACLICDVLLFAANTSAQHNKEPPVSQGRFGGSIGGALACGVSNPSPSPCTPIPKLLSAPPPVYSEQARKARIEGFCIVALIVDEKGTPTNVRLVGTGLGMGLDEKAIENVKNWKFEPALKDGKPVPAKIAVQVDFHL